MYHKTICYKYNKIIVLNVQQSHKKTVTYMCVAWLPNTGRHVTPLKGFRLYIISLVYYSIYNTKYHIRRSRGRSILFSNSIFTLNIYIRTGLCACAHSADSAQLNIYF